MRVYHRTLNFCRGRRSSLFPIQLLAFLLAAVCYGNINVRAQVAVLVEGNCESPVPGTTIVEKGTCGDFDGDGRIGTAEDTDGADRIFGTIGAALGPGTGAAAGTGMNFNGSITIVKSGRFFEPANIISANQGNVTIQAAPGVDAQLNAFFQGDPAGGNNTRLQGTGIVVSMPANSRVVLRNLTVRNFAIGIQVLGSSQVTIDNCRVENTVFFGILALNSSNVFITNSSVTATGYRRSGAVTCPGASCDPTPGHGIAFSDSSSGSVFHTNLSGNFGAGLANGGTGTVRYYEVFAGQNNNGNIINATRIDNP